MGDLHVDPEAIRKRAYALALLRPDASAEENWLQAEAELLAVAEQERRLATADANEREAAARAAIEMTAFGHG